MKSFKNLFAAFLLVIFAFTFTSKAFAADKTVKVENNYAIKSEDKKSNPKMVNETVTVKKNPQKVVVYDLGALDTITVLGKEKNVVAIPKSQHGLNMLNKDMKKIYSAKKYQNAGSLFEPDFETIAKLQPDLIIISGRSATSKNIEELKKAAPKAAIVYGSASMDANLITGVKEKSITFGKIFGKEKKAKAYNKELDQSLKKLKTKVNHLKNPSALFVIANSGELLSQSPKGRFGWIFKELGFKAVNEGDKVSTHGSPVSYEYISEKNPQYLFVLDRGATIGQDASADKILQNDVIKDTNAIKNNHVLQVNGKNWYLNTGGIRTTKAMIKEVQSFIDKK
ncbi:siderophore ABC transporter substrate-binding protein [Streptococcus mutans]|uniref:siderophore ABC transporter substrate-binding protein n=1 Tax=Streptococcus mutans TaxID=1309 RepID=UPI0002DCAEE0|nr:siderophore ABC transporter substrate-binding protein [Streptococcus mutans]